MAGQVWVWIKSYKTVCKCSECNSEIPKTAQRAFHRFAKRPVCVSCAVNKLGLAAEEDQPAVPEVASTVAVDESVHAKLDAMSKKITRLEKLILKLLEIDEDEIDSDEEQTDFSPTVEPDSVPTFNSIEEEAAYIRESRKLAVIGRSDQNVLEAKWGTKLVKR